MEWDLLAYIIDRDTPIEMWLDLVVLIFKNCGSSAALIHDRTGVSEE